MAQAFDAAIRVQKILVIDPSTFHRALASEALRAIGAVNIETAASAAEAKELAVRYAPTILILEWDLPDKGLDGIAFTKMIRPSETPFKRDVAIVIATSKASMAAVETARIAGVDEYVIKPFSTVALAARLEAIMLNRREFIDCPIYIGPCRRRKLVVSYGGTRRRARDTDEGLKKKLARTKIETLAKIAHAKKSGDRNGLRDLRKASADVLSISGEMEDKMLQTAAESLHAYIEGVRANALVDIKVVDAHVDAMKQVVMLPNAEGELRDQVARALQGLVNKKLSAKSA